MEFSRGLLQQKQLPHKPKPSHLWQHIFNGTQLTLLHCPQRCTLFGSLIGSLCARDAVLLIRNLFRCLSGMHHR